MVNTASNKDVADTRLKFYQAAKVQFPNTADPGACWVLTEVLGWSWDELTLTAEGSMDRKGYQRFVKDAEGKFVVDGDGRGYTRVTRLWTKQEKSKLAPWWWLLGL